MDDLVALLGRGHATLPLDLLAGLTFLGIAPLVVVMSTSFVRIAVVLSLVRSAIGAQSLPPSAVVTGLALVLTLLVMQPTFDRIHREALVPYAAGRLSPGACAQRAAEPLRAFMLRQTHARDLATFARIARRPRDERPAAAPLTVLVPAFVVGELRSAFAIGAALYLPFVAIDLAVAALLTALGMMMLSPPIVAVPCKLLLFVMVDGWALVASGVAASFR